MKKPALVWARVVVRARGRLEGGRVSIRTNKFHFARCGVRVFLHQFNQSLSLRFFKWHMLVDRISHFMRDRPCFLRHHSPYPTQICALIVDDQLVIYPAG